MMLNAWWWQERDLIVEDFLELNKLTLLLHETIESLSCQVDCFDSLSVADIGCHYCRTAVKSIWAKCSQVGTRMSKERTVTQNYQMEADSLLLGSLLKL